MSDPVTNTEVEDVLSSIRRLVSEDKRPLQAPKVEPANDRLVLTPALRVDEDVREDVGEVATEPTGDAKPAKVEEQADAAEVSLESLVTDDEPLDVYPDKGNIPAEDSAPAEDSVAAPDAAPAHEMEQDYSADPYRFDDAEDADGEGDQVDVVLTLSDEGAADLEDGPAPADTADIAEIEPETEVSTTAVLMPLEADEDHSEEEPALEETSDAKAATLTAKIAALETAIGQISETWEPDETGDSDYAGTEAQTMAWEDDIEEPETAAATPAPDTTIVEETAEVIEPVEEAQPSEQAEPGIEEEPAEAYSAADPALDMTEEQLIDEDGLRDLISDIVRTELQGALGERITRNVRKLVRREIHRALTAQDLE